MQKSIAIYRNKLFNWEHRALCDITTQVHSPFAEMCVSSDVFVLGTILLEKCTTLVLIRIIMIIIYFSLKVSVMGVSDDRRHKIKISHCNFICRLMNWYKIYTKII